MPIALVTHLTELLKWMGFEQIIGEVAVLVVVGEAEVVAPLHERDVKILVHEMESDLLLFFFGV